MARMTLFIFLFISIGVMGQDKLRIKGKIEGIPNEAKVVLASEGQKKDFKVTNGLFEVEMVLDVSPALVYIMVNEGDELNARYTFFFVGNESIEINGSIEDFPNKIQAKHSKYDEIRYEEYLNIQNLEDALADLKKEARELIKDGRSKDSIQEVYLNQGEPLGKIVKVIKEIDQKNFEFLKKHVNSPYGRYSLKFNLTQFTPDQFKELYSLVDKQYRDTEEVLFLKEWMNHKALLVGDSYYNFTATDINQKLVTFSNYFKDKYVLLDFSTFHCGYCQDAAPKSIKIAENLKNKLTYVTYYVDGDIEGLREYYKLKENKGNLLWDKKGRYSPTIAKYAQTGTPRYLLFDKKGKLVKEFVGFEENFEEQLRALMK